MGVLSFGPRVIGRLVIFGFSVMELGLNFMLLLVSTMIGVSKPFLLN